jgi:hypothetical protein
VGELRRRGVLYGKGRGRAQGEEGRAGGPGRAVLVDGDVAANDDAVTPVPRGALDPREGVEQGGGPAVASVDVVYPLEVEVAVLVEELAAG